MALPGFTVGDFEKFRAKVRVFLLAHDDHVAIRKLRLNHPLTATDLDELERILTESGIGSPEDIQRAKEESQGLGLFVRSLVGLDREAAKEALGTFQQDRNLTANQIEFLSLVIDHLTARGYMPLERLYESPFTDLSPEGIDGIFPAEQADALIQALEAVRKRAVA